MRELFPGFYKRTDKELSDFWEEGIFVFDTNMLLNIYRYASETRERYFEILDILKKRSQLWIPYQAAYEYQDRRIDVIRGQLEPYTKVESILQKTWQALDSSLEPYKSKHGIIDTTDLAVQLTGAIKSAKDAITTGNDKYKQYKQENVAFNKQDTLQEKLEELFQGNIGNPYTSSRLEELYKRAQLRMELRIPPGWEDEGKHTFRAYGDIVLWFQLIDYARTQKKSMVFVTDDGKKDWWIRDTKGKPTKTLPELVQEMFVEAGVLLHVYLGYEFLEQAERFLKLEEKPEVIEEAKEITEQNIKDVKVSFSGYLAQKAVQSWLEATYPQYKMTLISLENFDSDIDISLVGPDEMEIGVVIKFGEAFIFPQNWERLLTLARNILANDIHVGQMYDKFMAVIVCKDNNYAKDLRTHIPSMLSMPINSSIVIGYLTSANSFSVYFEIP